MAAVPEKNIRCADITAVILAGGQSSRMGSNKALLPMRGGLFIETIHRQLSSLFSEVLLVTNSPGQYAFLGSRMVADLFPGAGPLAGLHSALVHCHTPYIFVVACDMPYLNGSLINALAARCHQGEVVIPETGQGLEPLHAVYSRSCLPAVEKAVQSGRRRLVSFFPEVQVTVIPVDTIRYLDPDFASFQNVNTPEDYYLLRERESTRPPTHPFRRTHERIESPQESASCPHRASGL
jgi:molybdopterin-guanine dinucleotide biosynthesis protein A